MPDSIGQLSNLKTFTLCFSRVFKGLPDAFSQCSKMETIYMGSNDEMDSLPSGLGNLKQLKGLDVRDAPLAREGAAGLPADLAQLGQSENFKDFTALNQPVAWDAADQKTIADMCSGGAKYYHGIETFEDRAKYWKRDNDKLKADAEKAESSEGEQSA